VKGSGEQDFKIQVELLLFIYNFQVLVKGGLDLTKRMDKKGIFKNKPGSATFQAVRV
jgi:hypothetical protein